MDSPSSQSSRRENDAWSRYACKTPSRNLNVHAHTYKGTPCSKLEQEGQTPGPGPPAEAPAAITCSCAEKQVA